MIAVDQTTRENGCLQVIRGSHHMGRIEHGVTGQQTGADMERVEECLKRLERVYCEMEPGAGLFFHCNTLHRSDQNRSPGPRWTFLACYNAARNDPYKESGHPATPRWRSGRIWRSRRSGGGSGRRCRRNLSPEAFASERCLRVHRRRTEAEKVQ